MERTKWFERRFSPIEDNGLLPGIIERLEGTPARLYYKTGKLNDGNMPAVAGTPWSIKKEIGHLIDLESLWLERVEQLITGTDSLRAADLNNTRTHESDHDSKAILELLQNFFETRMMLVNRLRELQGPDLARSALHPRLQTPMRVIDLACFVAEHDDHHLAQITWIIQNDKSWMKAEDI